MVGSASQRRFDSKSTETACFEKKKLQALKLRAHGLRHFVAGLPAPKYAENFQRLVKVLFSENLRFSIKKSAKKNQFLNGGILRFLMGKSKRMNSAGRHNSSTR